MERLSKKVHGHLSGELSWHFHVQLSEKRAQQVYVMLYRQFDEHLSWATREEALRWNG